MEISGLARGQRVRPLEKLTVFGADGEIRVFDGMGREYYRGKPEFVVGGALGTHVVRDEAGLTVTFRVEAETRIEDGSGRMKELLTMLRFTMLNEQGEEHTCLWDGKIYRYFICWLRDHVHVLKGMKYFSPEVKSAIELYRDSQREDGMIWDNIYKRGPDPSYWEWRFQEGGFYRAIANNTFEFKRIPVENDVEYLYLEGIYFTWKATGDDQWMTGFLDSAKQALDYSVCDKEYRFSEKLGLLKRGYTIDTWDFQADIDCNVEGDIMRIRPGTTRFGAMFGDTTGYVAACRQLAEMLTYSGREAEAKPYLERAEAMAKRLDEVAWRGTHYQMHVPEDPSVKRDLGVDESKQVSLSNAYSLNRGIGEEKAKAIIGSYRRIKENLPEGSPGEWYTIYPPFERGFGGHSDKWQYMNASVTPIVAGELAHGAFEHKDEAYGADILARLVELGRRFDGQFHCSYTGCLGGPPKRRFETVDLSGYANCDIAGGGVGASSPPSPIDQSESHPGASPPPTPSPSLLRRNEEGAPGFPNSPNDLRELPVGEQVFSDVPFLVADPETNGRRGAIGLSERGEYAQRVEVPLGRTSKALYFLHTVSGGSGPVGTVTLKYTDGSEHRRNVIRNRDIVHWWMPELPKVHGRRTLDIGWKGKNEVLPYVGVSVWGLDNPHPEKELASLVLEAAPEGAIWHVIGLTSSDHEAWFPVSPISFGIPNGWGAAAVVYALVEGLAGVVDEATAFDRVRVSPRWSAAGEDEAAVTVHYPASGGYVSYRYLHDPDEKKAVIEITGSGEGGELNVLLPNGRYASRALDSLKPQRLEFCYE